MSSDNIKNLILDKALALGFTACGVARVQSVSEHAASQYAQWLAQGHNDCMDYAAKYQDIRNNPALLLDGAQSVISVALNYFPATFQESNAAKISYYAYGRDYHEVLRERLDALAQYISELSPESNCRVCVDTAPIREKYWAWQAGIGFIGRNGLLIIPGKGSFFFLGEIITTLALTPDSPCNFTCGDCNACAMHCPGGAIIGDGTIDARRCLSCQLIERRGDLPQWAINAKADRIYGCDECQKHCPHNRNAVATSVADFAPSPQILSLTRQQAATLTHTDFLNLFRHSAIRRAKLAGILRNAK